VRALAPEIAAVLAEEPFGLSCDVLAKRLARRRADVLAALRADTRFEHGGTRRGSRWRLAPEPWDGLGRKDRRSLDLDPSGVPTLGRRAASAA